MPLTPPQLVWLAHGSPAVDGCEEAGGRCYVCVGEVTRGQSVRDWLKASFTDQNRSRNPVASHVCEACCYVMSRTAPVLGRPPKDGKKHGGNFRNYSHLFEDGWDGASGFDRCCKPPADAKPDVVAEHLERVAAFRGAPGYANASKGEKPLIRDFLRREHGGVWFAALADSGQKHVLPFTPLNGPGRGGLILFDETRVVVPDALELVDAMAELLTAGATKEEVDRGDYRPMTWQRCASTVRMFEAEHGSGRGGAWFGLALWLAQRDEEAVAARLAAEKEAAKAAKARKSDRRKGTRKARDADHGGTAGDAQRVPSDAELQRAEALGSAPKQNARSSKNKRKPRGVGNEATAGASDPRTGQFKLPGFG